MKSERRQGRSLGLLGWVLSLAPFWVSLTDPFHGPILKRRSRCLLGFRFILKDFRASFLANDISTTFVSLKVCAAGVTQYIADALTHLTPPSLP